MLTINQLINPRTERKYVIEYGKDLFGNYVVIVRYGIRLGISKVYVFGSESQQAEKICEIKLKRKRNGYVLV